MKKKIVTSVIITVIFALVIITTSFMALSSIQEVENTKGILKHYNEIISKLISNNDYDFKDFKINNTEVRVTIINKDNKVIYDTADEKGMDYSNKDEIKLARENDIGYVNRKSSALKSDMIYCATKLKDGTIIRTGVPEPSIKIFYGNNVKFYAGAMIIVLVLSIALAFKLVRIIVDPVKHLQYVTSKIANGNLQTRVNMNSNDELGQLGKTFNNMADQLQSKINEVVDKQNRLESILKSMQSGVIAVDNNEEIITINPYAKRIFGITRDVTGEKLKNCIEDKNVYDIFENDDENEVEVKIKKPMRRFLKIKKATAINGYKQIGKVIAIQDITEMKRLENIRSQFVANVSHELKTPLTSIKGFAETLRYVDDEETKNNFLDIIDKESERLTRLINDILVLSNLESNNVEKLEEFMPDDIVREVINILQNQAIKKSINLTFKSNSKSYILGQRDKFFQVALNIIENGIKYSNEGDSVTVTSYNEDENYILKVKDTGIGIPEEDLPRIFERFYRVDKARKSGGTGLGLAIVKHIVKSFGGNIEVKSELNKGSEFIFKIKHL
ncbi:MULTISPECIES: HAMP domain-containing sensor histidine kinase [Clostridium]|uniref:histidine kinase n=1 Tax=Clostridium nitritogenes TaxID=83340 RepID=A0ABN1LMA4_9CLOT|nr:HAMP domain-containing sensor histidine kinase [Clostridium baratii]MBT9831794.1 HAMP domain-containing protein [Clostridium baratii]MDY3208519.1 ATP-binding protein [Clostridium baratii]STA99698.1 multi-sensor signal transduction histidine kinase [Clostridium baratii]